MLRSRGDFVAAVVTVALALAIAVTVRNKQPLPNFGYIADPAGAAKFARSLELPTYSAAAPDAMQRTKIQDVFLWRAADAAHQARYGKPWVCSNQRNVGSCVAHGAAHAVYIAAAIEWQAGERADPPLLVHQASIYGGSRVEARNKPGDGVRPVGGYSDGSTGYHAARWLRDWGVIWKQQYETRDCTTSNPELEREAGAYGCGGKGDGGRLDASAKLTPCHYVTQVKTWEEICVALCNGSPVTLASSQGFSRTLGQESFAEPKGVWLHQMCACGLRVSGNRPGVAIVNSWGDYLTYTAPRWPADLPDGVFWADKNVIERMLSQGDCWAISSVAFKYRPVNHHEWLSDED